MEAEGDQPRGGGAGGAWDTVTASGARTGGQPGRGNSSSQRTDGGRGCRPSLGVFFSAATATMFGVGGAAAAGSAGTGGGRVGVAGLVGGGSGRGESDARREVAQQREGDDEAAKGGDQVLSEPSP